MIDCAFSELRLKMVEVMNVGTGVNFSTKESFRTDVSFVFLFGVKWNDEKRGRSERENLC